MHFIIFYTYIHIKILDMHKKCSILRTICSICSILRTIYISKMIFLIYKEMLWSPGWDLGVIHSGSGCHCLQMYEFSYVIIWLWLFQYYYIDRTISRLILTYIFLYNYCLMYLPMVTQGFYIENTYFVCINFVRQTYTSEIISSN